MKELAAILEASRQADREGRRAVLATVVKVSGSTYRRPGARMLFVEGRGPHGLVSGGCLEADLAQRASHVFDSGTPQTVVYDMRSPDDVVWGSGLGCDGEIRVLLERLDPGGRPPYLAILEQALRRRQPAVVASVFATADPSGVELARRMVVGEGLEDPWREAVPARLREDARSCLERRRSKVETYQTPQGSFEALLEYVPPTVRLIVFGAGSDAIPVLRLAAELGWLVTLADRGAALGAPGRFPGATELRAVRFDRLDEDGPRIDTSTPVLVMTHHFLHDLELLQYLLPSASPYLGLLGPRSRTRKLLDELGRRGIRPTEAQLSRLHGPLGVDIGTETPEEIALSAVAEIQAVLNRRPAGFLRDRPGPLHPST